MARPTIKSDLIKAANEQFMKLSELLESMSETQCNQPFHFSEDFQKKEAHWKRDKNVRDVLIHLYEWHQLLLNWITANQNGLSVSFLPEPYNWRSYGQMNVAFVEKHTETSYEEAKKLLESSHEKVMICIGAFSNDELFTKHYFSWTGGSTLGSYCVSSTSSHYEWAIKKVKKHIKTLK